MAKKKTAPKKATKTAKTSAKTSAKKPMKKAASKPAKVAKKAANKVAKKSAQKSTKVAPKTAKKAASKMKAAPPAKKAAPKAPAKPAPKATSKSSSKAKAPATGKVISMDQARKSQAAAKASNKKSTSDLSSIFTPLDDRIVIQRAGVADRTPGGLYIPETVADRPNQGKVLAVGRGHLDKKGRIQPLDVQLGDTVMYAAYAGSEMTLNGLEVLVLRENEVIAIVKG